MKILVLGATQGVGQALLPMLFSELSGHAIEVQAISRQPQAQSLATHSSLIWHVHDLSAVPWPLDFDCLISLGPIDLALAQLKAATHTTPKAVWALSSASTDFKAQSPDVAEQALMQSILASETSLMAFGQETSTPVQILKTTLLYGRGDRNINRLAELIKRLRWFPILGAGQRAPVHVDDVAQLIIQNLEALLQGRVIPTGTWRLQGGEVLSYPQMIERIAEARRLKVSCIRIPHWPLKVALWLAHRVGWLADVKPQMLTRQADDLTVDDAAARQDLAWRPRSFQP